MRPSMSMQVSSDNRPSSGQESQEGRKSKGKEKAVVAPKGKEKRVADSQGSNNILGVNNIYQHPMPMCVHVNSECLMILFNCVCEWQKEHGGSKSNERKKTVATSKGKEKRFAAGRKGPITIFRVSNVMNF